MVAFFDQIKHRALNERHLSVRQCLHPSSAAKRAAGEFSRVKSDTYFETRLYAFISTKYFQLSSCKKEKKTSIPMFINEASTCIQPFSRRLSPLPADRARARCFPIKGQHVFFWKIISCFGKVYQGYGLLCKEYKKRTKKSEQTKTTITTSQGNLLVDLLN